MDQRKVMMAILVQPHLSDAHANGVAISKNPYRSDLRSYFVNTQIGGNLVTDASTSEHTAEQLIIYDIPQQGGAVPEILSLSSLNKGQPILERSDIRLLFAVLKALHKHFAYTVYVGSSAQDIDVEFLFLKDAKRSLVVLQCRPFGGNQWT